MTEEKTHYKMYKAKKRWMVAGITMFSAVLGTTAFASADTVTPNATNVSQSSTTLNVSSNNLNSSKKSESNSAIIKPEKASSAVVSSTASTLVNSAASNSNNKIEASKTQSNARTVKKVQTQSQSNSFSESKAVSSSTINVSKVSVSTAYSNVENSAVSQSQGSTKVQSNDFSASKASQINSETAYRHQLRAYQQNLAAQPQDKQIASYNVAPINYQSYDLLSEQGFETDKAAYKPGDAVHASLTFKNTAQFDQWGTWKLNVYNPTSSEQTVASGSWKASKGQSDTLNVDWKTPNEDNKGYVLDFQLFTSTGKLLTEYTNAVDVNTNPYNHPRYGALTDFSGNNISQEKAMVDSLAKAYHLNMQMLYDCYFEPQNPLPDQGSWKDWHGDTISKQAIQDIVNEIHQDGGKAFLYDMIGATSDKSMPQTGFYNPDNGDWINVNLGNGNYQYYHNIADADWQNYIIPTIIKQAKSMGFDGWQGDTPGNLYGNSFNQIKDKAHAFNDSDYYHYFASAVMNYIKKNDPNFAFGLNSVNANGQDAIAKDSNDTFDYSELWPNAFPTYDSIANVIEQNWKNDNKPLVVPAYIYNQWRDAETNGQSNDLPKTYNSNAVRQLIATIMANGGSPMVLADGGYLIDDEYYPWMRLENGKQINMSDALGNPQTGYMRHYFDFDTAYENILQNPELALTNNYLQVWDSNGVGQGKWINRNDAESNTVYAFAKSNGKSMDTINLVNLMGSTNQWQVNNSQDNNSHNVQQQKNLWIKYYPSEQNQNIQHIYLSSPDEAYQSKRTELSFKEYTDQSGHKYVEFEVPSLDIWDLVYMTTSTNDSNSSDTSSTTNSNINKYTYTITYFDGNTGAQVGTATFDTTSKLSDSQLADKVQSGTKDKVSSYNVDQDNVNGNEETITVVATVNKAQSNPKVYNYTISYFNSQTGASEGTYSFTSSTPLSGNDLLNKIQAGTKDKIDSYETDESHENADGNTGNITIVAMVGSSNASGSSASKPDSSSSSSSSKPVDKKPSAGSSNANGSTTKPGSSTSSSSNKPDNAKPDANKPSDSTSSSSTTSSGSSASKPDSSTNSSSNKPVDTKPSDSQSKPTDSTSSSSSNKPVDNPSAGNTDEDKPVQRPDGSKANNPADAKPNSTHPGQPATDADHDSGKNDGNASQTENGTQNSGTDHETDETGNGPESPVNGSSSATSSKAETSTTDVKPTDAVKGESKKHQNGSQTAIVDNGKSHDELTNNGNSQNKVQENRQATVKAEKAETVKTIEQTNSGSGNNETDNNSTSTSADNASVSGNSSSESTTSTKAKSNNQGLPQTGEEENHDAAEIGLAMLGVVGTVSIGFRRKRYGI